MILCHQLIILIFLLIHKFQENKLVNSDLSNLWALSCYSSLVLWSSIAQPQLFYYYSVLTIFIVTHLPLSFSASIRILIYLAPTDFLLGFVFLIFLSVVFHRSSIHCVITILTDSCTSLHNHNSNFSLGLLVTSYWLKPFQIFFINQLSDSTWII